MSLREHIYMCNISNTIAELFLCKVPGNSNQGTVHHWITSCSVLLQTSDSSGFTVSGVRRCLRPPLVNISITSHEMLSWDSFLCRVLWLLCFEICHNCHSAERIRRSRLECWQMWFQSDCLQIKATASSRLFETHIANTGLSQCCVASLFRLLYIGGLYCFQWWSS